MASQQAYLRVLGKDGPNIPALGLGLMGVSAGFLDYAVELGATFWDTSDIYGEGEEMLGRWFRQSGKRDKVFLATKFGLIMDGLKMLGVDSTAEYCKKACESSLAKLGVESIDLFYAHRVNLETPVEETMRAMVDLQKEGKIKHIRLCGTAYSPFVRSIESDEGIALLATCRELEAYLPTGAFTTQDSVSGADDIRAKLMPWWSEENLPTNAKAVGQLEAFASKKQCSVAQLTLAWILKQGSEMFAIPGTKKQKYLKENWDALEIILSDDEEAEIRKFVESIELAGFRSTPEAKALSYVDTAKEA
ncbi:aldo/keto reductase [Setomelanomma holmii]|uniref:Aldo/keto reductase n=1 Tax=Setomelanomma holmii TaxID=210430 RepID=A0A9P4H042_9PLEO|nr:aldo/keto reductase [Setomelanomma holmii]